MPVNQCNTNGCSHIIVQSLVQDHEIEIPVIESTQNGLQFLSTSMSISDVVFYSDIPAMDGTLNLREEADYTLESIGDVAVGNVPPRWQRPTKMARLQGLGGIPNWLESSNANTMPDGILLGVREEAHHAESFSIDLNNVNIIGGRSVRTATIRNNLLAACPNHGVFRDANGNQIYQNRCHVHGCEHHETTTSPLSIIDGQHRTIGLHLADIENKQVTISLLPIVAPDPNYAAYPIQRQAKVFEQVNSEGKKLDPNHLLWLKRMFGTWSTPPAPILTTMPAGRQAYDYLAYLGSTIMPAPAGTPWLGRVQFIQATGDYLANALFVTDPASGSIEGTAAMESNMGSLFAASGATGQSVQEIINCWLEAWIIEVGPQFAPGAGLFYNNRAFAALLRTMSISIDEMMLAGIAPLNVAAFRAHINPHSVDMADPNWDRFTNEGGEEPQKNMYNILKQMLRSGGGAGPVQLTYAGAGAAPTWADWVNLAPDPLTAFSHPTLLVGGTQIPCPDIDPANARVAVGPGDILEWESPVNIGRKPTAYWRPFGGAFSRINQFNRVMPQDICSDNRLCRLDLGTIGGGLGGHVAAAAGDFDLEIIYVNSAGTRSTIVLGFTC